MDAFIWTSEEMKADEIAALLQSGDHIVNSVIIMNRATGKAMDTWGSPLMGPEARNILILQPILDLDLAATEDENTFR